MAHRLENRAGFRLRIIREQMGLSREAFAEMLQISTRYLANIESGAKSMSAALIARCCRTLHISADYLMLGREPLTKPELAIEMLSHLEPAFQNMACDLLTTYTLAVGQAKQEAADVSDTDESE